MTATQLITVEEFVGMPDEVTDHHELVEGELVEVPSSTPKNSRIRDKLLIQLTTCPSSNKILEAFSELDVRT